MAFNSPIILHLDSLLYPFHFFSCTCENFKSDPHRLYLQFYPLPKNHDFVIPWLNVATFSHWDSCILSHQLYGPEYSWHLFYLSFFLFFFPLTDLSRSSLIGSHKILENYKHFRVSITKCMCRQKRADKSIY